MICSSGWCFTPLPHPTDYCCTAPYWETQEKGKIQGIKPWLMLYFLFPVQNHISRDKIWLHAITLSLHENCNGPSPAQGVWQGLVAYPHCGQPLVVQFVATCREPNTQTDCNPLLNRKQAQNVKYSDYSTLLKAPDRGKNKKLRHFRLPGSPSLSYLPSSNDKLHHDNPQMVSQQKCLKFP